MGIEASATRGDSFRAPAVKRTMVRDETIAAIAATARSCGEGRITPSSTTPGR
jgi:hypothetical protein